MNKYLNEIHTPSDVKKLSCEELEILANEVREKLISEVSKTGGHLASNLGTIELTIALHKVFDCPKDEFVWDVGHQSYTHKMLTGRLDKFNTLRQKGGISGFPKHKESEYDAFVSGHASTSVSAAYGIAQAKKISGDDGYSIAIVGDGSFTGGLIYEGLNNSGKSDTRLIVILNDNEMSISKSVGGLARYFSKIRNKKSYFVFKDKLSGFLKKIPLIGNACVSVLYTIKKTLKDAIYNSNFFEDLGFTYLGPVDGHSIEKLIDILERAKELKEPVLVHVNTIKGKGYDFAEKSPSEFHGVSKFDVETGDTGVKTDTFTNHFSKIITQLAQEDKRICAITAAMKESTGLEQFSLEYPERFFDVGIAEAHAVTFSAALAQKGYVPVVALYSTFLQRAYDQIIHDVAIEKQHVVFAIDRAGIVGDDGETHQGVFDVSFLNHIPSMTVFSPSNYDELEKCFKKAVYEVDGPVAVRYPRGGVQEVKTNGIEYNGFEIYGKEKTQILVVTYGRISNDALQAMELLEKENVSITVLKLIQVSPIPEESVSYATKFDKILFFEEGIEKGSAAYSFLKKLNDVDYKGYFNLTAIDDVFVPQATVKQSLSDFGLDCQSIVNAVKKAVQQ